MDGATMERLAITQLQVFGSELAIAWSDGREQFLSLEYLRRNCPCAACAGEPDGVMAAAKPQVHYSAASFLLRQIDRIGGYALQPIWQDGHQTGLYSYQYLRELEDPAGGSEGGGQ